MLDLFHFSILLLWYLIPEQDRYKRSDSQDGQHQQTAQQAFLYSKGIRFGGADPPQHSIGQDDNACGNDDVHGTAPSIALSACFDLGTV